MLASTEGGDLFVWGCGLTHQLANRPRDVSNPTDADEEPADELRPYQVSSKQLQNRFVIVADGGAQHSVELAWGGEYSTLSQEGAAPVGASVSAVVSSDPASEPPLKRRATEKEVTDGMQVSSDDAGKLIPAFGTSPESVKPTGFGFGGGASTSGTAFGTGSAGSVVFGFGTGTPAQADGAGTSGSFGGGFGSGFGSGFGQSGSSTGAVTFGFGSQAVTFGTAADAAGASTKIKELDELPDFATEKVPVGDVFVHGSGECDQLGLGDDMRERKKPTLLKSLIGKSICEIAVGAMHVLCLSTGGAVYCWGCNDDGALGRAPSDGWDGGPSDVEPHPVTMPSGVAVRHVSCGDCHSCALDEKGRAWLWGTYKDSNGYIGIAHKRKQETEVLEKSAEPTLVLEGCVQVASGANHTVALAAPSGHNQVFAWGSNATGQLGLQDACGFSERTLPCSGSVAGLSPREGGGCEVAGEQVVRIHQADGSVRAATSMTAEQVQQAVVQGASALVLQVAEREVPKPEKQKLLQPQHVPLEVGAGEHVASAVHASAECSFVTFEDGAVFGCGLNGDGQVGLGFVSMAVQQLQAVPAVRRASWIGGGLHSTAALVDGRVFTWGKAEECGIGLGEKAGASFRFC